MIKAKKKIGVKYSFVKKLCQRHTRNVETCKFVFVIHIGRYLNDLNVKLENDSEWKTFA